ncbi:MAG: hypothetical protein JRH18_07130 [Deltaproteobacteria bacterium]|nr:hypothetical protein [Deltaproteobacteria bacterium]MBW1960440.1 hypothetical protein [Deltaproteobacteria bacterium]MBW1996083.1 hypothetical protein [Deltaproteobacteria bacterium]MBW2151426.1 hypothetical protein [Deltaproteobacteria bacterium]
MQRGSEKNRQKRIIVQIYEVQDPFEVEPLVGLGVDHIGSVLISGENWKTPAVREVIHLVQSTSAKSCLIPLFSDPNLLLNTLDYYQPDVIHFCEDLVNSRHQAHDFSPLMRLQEAVKERFPEIKTMRSIPIRLARTNTHVDSLRIARIFEPVTDFFLTDTWLGHSGFDGQPVSGFVGITGKPCDWNIAASLVRASRVPVILAGGISAENVSDGIKKVQPAGVDSCTLTNMVDEQGRPIRFKKDLKKVRKLVEAVRRAEREFVKEKGESIYVRCERFKKGA